MPVTPPRGVSLVDHLTDWECDATTLPVTPPRGASLSQHLYDWDSDTDQPDHVIGSPPHASAEPSTLSDMLFDVDSSSVNDCKWEITPPRGASHPSPCSDPSSPSGLDAKHVDPVPHVTPLSSLPDGSDRTIKLDEEIKVRAMINLGILPDKVRLTDAEYAALQLRSGARFTKRRKEPINRTPKKHYKYVQTLEHRLSKSRVIYMMLLML